MQFFKTGDVVKAGEESCHELLICYLFPSEICSDFRQHIVSQLLFFFFSLMFLHSGGTQI